jgi:DNA gyrase subunit A
MARQTTRGGTGRGGSGRGSRGSGGAGAPPGDGESPVEGYVEPIEIQEEMERSFLEYSMSVIVARALPDVRDGLKPVHRRILYSMFDRGLRPDRPHNKCAKVVGDVMGTYHPHGDSAIYEALARMVQEFSLRHPLIDGHGSFGGRSPDDGPAAMRYTECRLAPLALELMADIDEETVDMVANYDGSDEEPVVLPGRFPNLLINGSQGIAVGMATNIPPHNMSEVIKATIHLIDNPRCSLAELIAFVPGPDFPTGGFIHGIEGIHQAYATGRGHIQVRGRAEIEVHAKTERETIVITEIPFQVNKARLIERIAELVRDKKLEGVSDIRDESDRDGMRIVVEVKRDAMGAVVLNNIFAHTSLQETFSINMLAIDNGQPRTLGLKEILERFVAHRREVVMRRTRYELRKAREREHILLGLKIALDQLDAVIKLIRAAKDREIASHGLQANFGLTEIQAKAILEMQLQRLTGLERQKILDELAELQKTIARLEEILRVDRVLLDVIIGELRAIQDQFGDERRTEIVGHINDLSAEDLIADEDMVVTLSHAGYVKRNPITEYRSQRRGGRGKIGAGAKDDDYLEDLFVASAHAYVLVFSSRGRVYWLKVHEIPAAGRAARGKAIVNLVQFKPEEKLAAILPVKAFEAGKFVVMVTQAGIIKKTSLDQFQNPRQSGIVALGIEDGDTLVAARLTDGTKDLLLTSKQGMSIRFKEDEVRAMGRTAYGVKGITLDAGDVLVSAEVVEPGASILSVTENGFGKRTEEAEYRLQGRGGKGIITIKTTERNGGVVGAVQVTDADNIMVITNKGMLIRMPARDISVIGRNTQGVRLIDIGEAEEKVVGLTRVAAEEAAGVADADAAAGEKAAPEAPANGEASPDEGAAEEDDGEDPEGGGEDEGA